MTKIISIILFSTFLLTIFLVIYKVLWKPPEAIKNWFMTYAKSTDSQYYPLSKYAKKSEKQSWVLPYLKWTMSSKATSALIWLTGGCMLYTDILSNVGFLNELFENIGTKCDIYACEYPVRFDNTVRDAAIYIDKFVSKIFVEFGYKKFILGGSSAGALLMAALSNKESWNSASGDLKIPKNIHNIKYEALIGISGLYSPKFKDDKISTTLFGLYIMRSTPGKQWYDWRKLKDTVKLLLISSDVDFLYKQTQELIAIKSTAESLIFTNQPECRHGFHTLLSLEATKDAIRKIEKFIAKVIDGAN